MAKAKLATVTKKWIDGKTGIQHDAKPEKQQDAIRKTKQTVYISREAAKLLWYNRAETGEPICHTVERLVMKHLARKRN